MKTILFSLLLAFATLAQANHEQNIRATLQAQADAWNRGDVRGFMAYYWQSEQLRFGSGNTITYGFEATQKRFLDKYNTPEKMGKLNYEVIEVNLFNNESAQVFGRWRLTREHDTPNGLLTLNLKKFNDRWLIVTDHTSSE